MYENQKYPQSILHQLWMDVHQGVERIAVSALKTEELLNAWVETKPVCTCTIVSLITNWADSYSY